CSSSTSWLIRPMTSRSSIALLLPPHLRIIPVRPLTGSHALPTLHFNDCRNIQGRRSGGRAGAGVPGTRGADPAPDRPPAGQARPAELRRDDRAARDQLLDAVAPPRAAARRRPGRPPQAGDVPDLPAPPRGARPL